MVASLIDNDTRWRKVEAVRSIFLLFEASTIFKIPLNYNLPEDSLIWIGNKRGVFTVRSAYHIASSLVDSNEEGDCSYPNSRKPLETDLASENPTKAQNLCLEVLCKWPPNHAQLKP